MYNDTATTEIYTLSLHEALPIYRPKFIPIEEPIVLTSEENIDFETNQISEIEKTQIYEKPLISENSKKGKISLDINFNPNKKILLAIATIA